MKPANKLSPYEEAVEWLRWMADFSADLNAIRHASLLVETLDQSRYDGRAGDPLAKLCSDQAVIIKCLTTALREIGSGIMSDAECAETARAAIAKAEAWGLI